MFLELVKLLAGSTQKSYGALDTYSEENGRLQAKRLRELVLMHSSRRYLDRVVLSLEQRRGKGAKLRTALAELQTKREESRRSLKHAHAKLAALQARLRKLKEHAESSTAALFPGKSVSLIGALALALDDQQ